MRLIDADKLKKHIRRCDDSATRATFDYVHEDDIDDMPTVDVLEQISDEVNKLKKVSDGNKVYVVINDVFDIIDNYR